MSSWRTDKPETARIADLVKERMGELGLKQTPLSHEVSGHEKTFGNLFAGRSPNPELLAKLAQRLGLEFYFGPPRDPEPTSAEYLARRFDSFMHLNEARADSIAPKTSSEPLPAPDPEIAHRLLEYRTGEADDGHVALKLDLEEFGGLVSLLTPEQARDMSARLAHMALEVERAQPSKAQKTESRGAA